MQQLHIEVSEREDAQTIGDVIRRRWTVSSGFLKTVKRQRQIWRNGRPARVTERVKAGDRLTVGIPAAFPDHLPPEPLPLAVVYEDDWLMVVDKPPGLVVHQDRGASVGNLGQRHRPSLAVPGRAARLSPRSTARSGYIIDYRLTAESTDSRGN